MDDLISRQAVINKTNERQRKLIYCFGFENDMVKIMNIAKSIVTAIPSAQPIDVQEAYYRGKIDGVKECKTMLRKVNEEFANE